MVLIAATKASTSISLMCLIETSVTAPIEICNESDQRRFYSIRLDGQTNPLGAIIDLNGRNLNNHFEGQAFELEPNACLKALLIIRPNPALPTQQAYENIKLYVRPGNGSCTNDCDDENVEDVLFLSITYNDTGHIDYCGNVNALTDGQFEIPNDDPNLKSGSKPTTAVQADDQPGMAIFLAPNPTSHFVHMHYKLPFTTAVTITIHDVNGTPVRKIISNQLQDAGKHSIHLQNLELPAGTYMVKLQTDEEVMVNPLVVINT